MIFGTVAGTSLGTGVPVPVAEGAAIIEDGSHIEVSVFVPVGMMTVGLDKVDTGGGVTVGRAREVAGVVGGAV